MRPRVRPKLGLSAVLLLLPLGLGVVPSIVAAQTSPKSDTAPQTSEIKLPPGVERATTVEGITEYRLQNGLRVLLFPDQTKEVMSVNLTYLVGSRHESYGETGMAHLLEHLLFKGTPKHRNIWKEFSDRGVRANATTHYDRTNYYGVFSATDENLEWALELEADRMVNSFIAKKDLDSEMTVVRNELEGKENNPSSVLAERVMATAFEWHNYGKAVLGARADVENVPIDRLQAFYRTFYRPDNAVLIVAGKISEQNAIDLVHKHFGPIPRPERALPHYYTAEPAQDGERQVTIRRVGDYAARPGRVSRAPASHPDFAAVALAVNILGHAPSGRLHKRLVEAKKASSTSGNYLALRDSSYLFFAAVVRKEESLADARDALEEAVESLVADPPSPEEIERARARFANSFEANLENRQARRRRAERMDGAGRLAALLPAPRPPSQGRRGGCQARRGRLPEAVEPDTGPVRPDGEGRPRASPRRERRRDRRDGARLQGRCGRRGRRGVRPLAREHRSAHGPQQDRQSAAGPAAEEDARQQRRVAAVPADGRREEPHAPRPGGERGGSHADARNRQAHAPADPGRARPAEGVRQRFGQRDRRRAPRSRRPARTCRRCCAW